LELAQNYYEGKGVAQDYKRAFELFQQASESKTCAGRNIFLEFCYANGTGVDKD